jgi:hypothetical protein
MHSRRSRLLWILLAAVGLLLVVAVVSGVIYLVLRQQRTTVAGWQDPIAAILPEEIAPDLALYPLAGASQLDTVDAAIANGDLELAYAAIALSLDIPDAQRTGRLILLGRRFEEAEKGDRAALCYQQIYDIAILHPWLNDPARADALLASAKGWADLGQESQALSVYDQVFLIALHSPYLQGASRRHLLAVLETAYRDLGDTEQAAACREEIIELDQELQPQPPAVPGESPDLPRGDEAVSSPEVGALEEARRQEAYVLLEALAAGKEASPGLVSGLGQALQNEDAAKLELYRQELEGTTQPGRRIDVNWQMIRWLMLKYQVAAQGFGLSLVPDWEARLADIQSDLSKAYEDLFFDYEDLVAALPEAGLMGPGSYQVRREVILAGRLGRYPNYPAPQLVEKLQDAVANLIAAGSVDRLYVDVTTEDEDWHFFFSPVEQYGLSTQSP